MGGCAPGGVVMWPEPVSWKQRSKGNSRSVADMLDKLVLKNEIASAGSFWSNAVPTASPNEDGDDDALEASLADVGEEMD